MTLTNFLSDIADAIRDMDGSTEAIPAKEFPDRIRKIGGGTANLSVGTFIPVESTKLVVVEHGLSVVPNFSIVFLIDDISSQNIGSLIIASMDIPVSDMIKNYEIRSVWGNIHCNNKDIDSSEQLFAYNDTKVEFHVNNSNFYNGKKYMWIVGRIDIDEQIL